ncbi:MAG: hypothetical protein GX214_08015 [Clostridiales bacterium]|nr:hypothetical protein [Clostridiales bacterium]
MKDAIHEELQETKEKISEEIKRYLNKNYQSNIKSLKDISYDKENKEYLSNLETSCMSYDDVIKDICKKDSILEFASPDAIFFKNDIVYFIEFKNAKIFDKYNKEYRMKIKLKLVEGGCIGLYKLANLAGIAVEFSDIIKLKKKYLVVYNSDKATKNANNIRNHLRSKLAMQQYKGTYVEDINIISSTSFDSTYKSKNLWN